MKTPLPLFCLLLTTAPAFAQMQPTMLTTAERAAKAIAEGAEMTEPFKGANTILIHTTDSAAVALKKFARALILAGIEPDRIDAEIGYLTTKGKAIGTLTPAVYAYRVVSTPERGGTVLTISGDYTVRVGLTGGITAPMRWTPGNGNQGKGCFAVVEPAALAYPGGRIWYKQGALIQPVMH